jgi:hypothetical protein
MKRRQVYDAWKQKRRQADCKPGFADAVMNRIHEYEQEKHRTFSAMYELMEMILSHPLARAALIIVGALIGLMRVAFVVGMFLRT